MVNVKLIGYYFLSMLFILCTKSIAIIIPVPQVIAFLTISSNDKSMLFKLIEDYYGGVLTRWRCKII